VGAARLRERKRKGRAVSKQPWLRSDAPLFLNVDLEIESRSRLDPLIEVFS